MPTYKEKIIPITEEYDMECVLSGCSNKSKNSRKPALCWSHYQRKRKYGDPREGFRCKRGLFSEMKQREIPEIKKAYWAGFFDGEGSVGIYSSKNTFTYRCTISQSKPHTKILWEIAGIYDGSVTGHSSGCDCLQLSSLRAYEFLKDILPYSVIKKEQIETFLTTVDHIRLGKNLDVSVVVKKIADMKRVEHVSAI